MLFVRSCLIYARFVIVMMMMMSKLWNRGCIRRYDDRQKFVSILKSRLEYESRRTLFDKTGKKVVDEPLPSYMKTTRMFFPDELWTWVVYSCAVGCATAMLEGETGLLDHTLCYM